MIDKEDVKKILEKNITFHSQRQGYDVFNITGFNTIAQQIYDLNKPQCSRCSEKAEWVGIDKENLCQIHWEEYCSEQWFETRGGLVKPDESGLLDTKVIINYLRELDISTPTKEGYAFLKFLEAIEAQRDLTASIKDAEWKAKLQLIVENAISDQKDADQFLLNKQRAECQERVERIIELFKDTIPCMPNLFGHGCDQEHSDCGKCNHILDIIDSVKQVLKKEEGVE